MSIGLYGGNQYQIDRSISPPIIIERGASRAILKNEPIKVVIPRFSAKFYLNND